MEDNALTLGADILGCLIVHPEAFTDLLDGDVFEFKDHIEVFYVLKKLYDSKKIWDIVLVRHELPESLRYAADDWTSENNNLIFCPSLLPSYVDKLNDYKLASDVAKLYAMHNKDPLLLAEKVKERALSVKSQCSPKNIGTFLKDVFLQIEKASNNKNEITGVPSGFSAIDSITWGFQPQRLYLLAGRPSMGKSALGMNIAHNAAKAGKKVYFQSLEESSQSLCTRMLSKACKIETNRLLRGQLNEGDWGVVSNSLERLNKLPLIIDESCSVSSRDIYREVMKEHSKEKIDLLIIDHIQQIREKEQNRHLELSQAAFNFKELAKELRIPVLVMCQLNRGVEARADKHPLMSDLKESGDLEAIADVVMLLYREAYYDHECVDKAKVEMSIAKNRDGRTGTILLSWSPEVMSFSNYL